MDFRKLSIDETFKTLNTSIKGLNNEEVLKRKKKYGLNKFKVKNLFFNLFIKQLFNPIILLLIIAFIFKIVNKSHDSIILFVIMLLIMLFNTILEFKYEYPINFNKLKFKKATVIRDGKKIKIKPKNITIGDILVIEKNAYIKADIKVIVGNDIEIISPLNNDYTEFNTLLAGDYIKCGSGMGIVFNIGKNTEIYKLALKISKKRKQKLPFQNKVKKFNLKLSLFTLFLSLLLGLILYINKVDSTLLINQCINLIITFIPVFYIFILVLILYRYKRKYKNINSLSLLGSIGEIDTIICNKDDLFTLNEISSKVIELVDGSIYNVESSGYNDVGNIVPINPKAKYKDSLYNLSLLGKLVSLNNKATLKYEEDKWNYSGNPFDIAFISLNQKINNVTFDNKIVHEIDNDDYLITFYKEDDDTKFCIRGNIKNIIEFCPDEKDIILEKYDNLKALGYKVLGVAYGSVKNKKKYNEKDIKDSKFLGLVGFINPLKEDSINSIKRALDENISVIVNSNEDINTSEIFGKELNIINKRNEIASLEDVVHNYNLGERIFDEFVKDIKIFSNVDSTNLLHIINSFKRRNKKVAFISNNVDDIDVLKNSNVSITSNNSIIKCSSDFVMNDTSLDEIIAFIKDGKNIFNVIYNLSNYLILSKFIEMFIVLLFTIFNPKVIIPINFILWLDLSIYILSLGLILRFFDINGDNYTKIYIFFKKNAFKWIITSILISTLVYMFKISNIHSILFLIVILYSTLLFIYKTNFSKYELRDTIKLYLFMFLYIVIQSLIFSIKLDIKTIMIIDLICLLPLIIMELVKFIQKKSR